MTQRKQYRGRQVQPKRSPLPLFYSIMATLLLVGVGMLVWTVRTRATTAPPSSVSVAEAVRPLTAATGPLLTASRTRAIQTRRSK